MLEENFLSGLQNSFNVNFLHDFFLLHVHVLLYDGPNEDVRTTFMHLYGSGGYMTF